MQKYLIQNGQGLFLKSLQPEIWHVDRSQAWIMIPDEVLQAIFQFEADPDFFQGLEILEANDQDFFDDANLALDAIEIDLSEVEDGYIEQSRQLRQFNGDLSELM